MNRRSFGAVTGLLAMLSACGGGGSGSAPVSGTSTGSAVGSAVAACSLRSRQDWAAAQLSEWYLFPETLPANLDPTPYANVQDYIDALTATARSQRRDRYFTYLTSIADENAYYASGASAGFGIRLSTNAVQRRAFVTEAFEGAPALAAGIDRGTEILAIGTTAADLRTVDSIIAAEGVNGVTDALGPTTAGVARLLRVNIGGAVRDLTVTKASYDLPPVSSRYGAKVIDDGGKKVGYLNLRTFITSASTPLRAAFQQFRDAGVTEVVIDLRYNGGGLVSVSKLIGDLLGRDRAASDVFAYEVFRPEKSSENVTYTFAAKAESIAPTKIAFIGTGGTASASEFLINGFVPYLHGRAALIGANTFGKPVGQIALDKTACDDRLRVIAFATQNSARQGAYYDGLAGTVEASCKAEDDLTRPMGDPQEASTRQALDFLAGKTCTPISTALSAQAAGEGRRVLLSPSRPDTAQREVPGLF